MATIAFEMPRRRAEVTLDETYQEQLGVDSPVQLCHVLGLFQVSYEYFYEPVFVCELDDGTVIKTEVSAVKFLDTEGGIML